MFARLCPLLLVMLGICHVVRADEPNGASAANSTKLQVLVITGGHPFATKPFHAIFAGYTDMNCTFLEETTGGEAFDDVRHWPYDAMVLYNHCKKLSAQQQANFLRLLDQGVGLVILHHAIWGYRPWPEFQKMVGVTSWTVNAAFGKRLPIHVEDPQHPITRGLHDFLIADETYQGYGVAPTVHVVLSTDEPTNVKPIAWVHTYRKSPVCYFQLGHGESAYATPEYRAVVGQAIRWSAGRLKDTGDTK